jgi:hypothetical protein
MVQQVDEAGRPAQGIRNKQTPEQRALTFSNFGSLDGLVDGCENRSTELVRVGKLVQRLVMKFGRKIYHGEQKICPTRQGDFSDGVIVVLRLPMCILIRKASVEGNSRTLAIDVEVIGGVLV